jgi:cyclohexyl-isocyanide hydratase
MNQRLFLLKTITFVLFITGSLRSNAAPSPSNKLSWGASDPVYILLYNGFTALDVFGPHQMLTFLGPNHKIIFVSTEKNKIVTTDSDVQIVAQKMLSEISQKPGLFLVPGGTIGTIQAAKNPALLRLLQFASAKHWPIVSICTGSMILGKAGLLRGRHATGHWITRPFLTKFGAIRSDDRFVVDENILTSAGVSAGIDLGLKIVALEKGVEIAKKAQLDSEYDPMPPFDSGTPSKAGAAVVQSLQPEYADFLKQLEDLTKSK